MMKRLGKNFFVFCLLLNWSNISEADVTANKRKVIIIGAGPAGLAAGTKLLELGIADFRILEAESRFGGRIHTIPFADNVVDLGAQWCHGEKNNVVYEMVKDLDMLESETESHKHFDLIRSNGEQIVQSVSSRLEQIGETLRSKLNEHGNQNETALDLMKRRFAQLLENDDHRDIDKTIAAEFFQNFEIGECAYESADSMAEIPASGEPDYEICDGDLLLSWQDKGYKSFLDLLLKSKEIGHEFGMLKNHLELSKAVKSIAWQRDDGKVLVTREAGEEILADHVIVTVSLGVLKATHQQLFQPPLPLVKQHAIENINFGTVNKIFIEFETAFWPKDWTGFCLLWRAEDLQQIRGTEKSFLEGLFGFSVVGHQPRILEGWMLGKFGRQMEKMPIDVVRNETVALLKRSLAFDLTPVLNFTITKWYTNPNFRGTYTYHSIDMKASGAKPYDLELPLNSTLANCAEDEPKKCPKPLVLFAGEATNTKHYSTVHGAVESGWREAQRLADYYKLKMEEKSLN